MATLTWLRIFYVGASLTFASLSLGSLWFFIARGERPGLLLCGFLGLLATVMYRYGRTFLNSLERN